MMKLKEIRMSKLGIQLYVGLPALRDISSFSVSPCCQCLASCQKLARATSRLDIFKFFSYLKIRHFYRIEKNICCTSDSVQASNSH